MTRPRKVTIRAQDIDWQVLREDRRENCWRAPFCTKPIISNGKLYISHISALKRDLMKRKIRQTDEGRRVVSLVEIPAPTDPSNRSPSCPNADLP